MKLMRLTTLLVLMAALPLHAAKEPGTYSEGWFPFNISALDGSPTAIDLSWLNERPAGASGY